MFLVEARCFVAFLFRLETLLNLKLWRLRGLLALFKGWAKIDRARTLDRVGAQTIGFDGGSFRTRNIFWFLAFGKDLNRFVDDIGEPFAQVAKGQRGAFADARRAERRVTSSLAKRRQQCDH